MAVGCGLQIGLVHADALQLVAQSFRLLDEFEEASLQSRRQSLFGIAQHGGDIDGGRLDMRGGFTVLAGLAAGETSLPSGRRDRRRPPANQSPNSHESGYR